MSALARSSNSGIRQIPLAAIKLDPLAQPRAEIDHELVEEYCEAMAAGEQFPPLVVFNDRRSYWLADGFHRHGAALQAGLREVACLVHDGGQRDAILHSCSANAAHGWRRSNGDKRRAVLTLLADEEWGKWPIREIARRSKVSVGLVHKVQEELTVHGEQLDEPREPQSRLSSSPPAVPDEVRHRAESIRENGGEPRFYKTKHGTVSVMDTGGLRGRGNRSSEHGNEAIGAVSLLETVQALVTNLLAVNASPQEVIAGCANPEQLNETAELCARGGELLTGLAAYIQGRAKSSSMYSDSQIIPHR